jgi:hypothetical protein
VGKKKGMKTIFARLSTALILIGVTAGILSGIFTTWLDFLSLKGFRVMGASADISEIKTAISWVAQTHAPHWLSLTNLVVDKLARFSIYPGLLFVLGLLFCFRKQNAASTERIVIKTVLICLSIIGILFVYEARSLDRKATGRIHAFASKMIDEGYPDRTREEAEQEMATWLQHHRDQLMYDGMSLAGFVMVGAAVWGINRKGYLKEHDQS